MTMKKQKTLHRFAAVAAVLLAFCLVFMMPVSAEGTDGVIDTWEELKTALEAGEDVTLGGNIDVPSETEEVTKGDKTGPKIKEANVINIAAGTTVALDLNGYSISAIDPNNGADSSWNYALFTVSGTLTITDSSADKSGKITVKSQHNNWWNRFSAVIAVQQGTAIINGGTLEHLGGTDMAYGIDVLTNTGSENAKLIVNGGSIESTYRAVRLFLNSKLATCYLEVNGGSISSNNNAGVWIQDSNANVNPFSVTINGGSISGKGGAIYVEPNTAMSGTLTIDSGTLTSTSSDYGAIRLDDKMASIESGFVLKIDSDACLKNTAGGATISGAAKNALFGVGTSDEPYTIDSKAELQIFRDSVNNGNNYAGKYVQLTANIDLNNEEWTPIGVYGSNLFKGHFDGNEKTISNLKISSGSYVGLFGHINDVSVTITDLTINNVQITGTSFVGALAGWAQNTKSISNCDVTGTIKIEGNNNVGGLTGQTYTGTIQSCTVIGDSESYVKGTYAENNEGTKIGGLIGHAGESSGTIVINCHTDINVIGLRGIGGLLGYIGPLTPNSGAKIEGCSSAGPVTLSYQEDYSGTEANGKINAGALIGEVKPGSSPVPIKDSTSTSTILVDGKFEDIPDKVSVGFIGALRGDTYNSEDLVSKISNAIESSSWEVSPENYNDLVEKGYIKLDSENIPVDVKIWEISVDENNGDFGEATEGYNTLPEAKTFTITNTGTQIVSLNQVDSSKFTVNGLPVVISADGTASITVQPKLGLDVGTHSETLVVTDTVNSTAIVEITVTFEVNAKAVEPGDTSSSSSSGSATDTGSGNYQYYPRSVPTDGIIDFGTSRVVTGMELPAGSDGTVTLNIKPTFTMPENGFYAFEIDAPGYNTDAKINGGLSFQIPVADLEAAGWTAEDIVLFHGTVGEDGKIVWEALPTNLVKNENGVAYYKAAINGCSPFYIGFVKDGSVVNTEVVDPVTPETPETPVTPDEPEVLPPVDEPETPEQPTESPAPILAVLAGLGAAVVLRRK